MMDKIQRGKIKISSVALIIEHIRVLFRTMIKICSYDAMKLVADKSLEIFYVHSALMRFFSTFYHLKVLCDTAFYLYCFILSSKSR